MTGTGSFGLWTVIERGGYLYVQTTDNGIQVYNLTSATVLGSLYTTYTKAELDAATGYTAQYYGLDVSADGKQILLGASLGNVYELQQRVPVLSGQWQLRAKVQPFADNPPQLQNTTYNPRYFDGEIYATEISTDPYRCFGRYASGSRTFLGGGIPAVNEHRMLGRLRGPGGTIYLMGSGGVMGDATTFVPTFTRYDSDYSASNPVAVNSIDNQVVESFDWVDDDTIISTCYVSGQRNRLYLTDVTADPFALTKNTTWNANGYVTTPVSTRIRNVRKGDVFSGYAYYGDAGQNNNPGFYAIDLATGVSTLLGNLGTLTGAGSFGLWTVIERGGYLYVQTTDNGIQVYNMTSATVLGSLHTTYTKAELDAATGYTAQYYGLDVSADGKQILLGASLGNVYELEPALRLSITQSGRSVILSWPASHTGVVVESSATLEPSGFADLSPQPAVTVVGDLNIAIIPADPAAPAFFRLRK